MDPWGKLPSRAVKNPLLEFLARLLTANTGIFKLSAICDRHLVGPTEFLLCMRGQYA